MELTTAEWVKENIEGLMPEQVFSPPELAHITTMCEHIYEGITTGRPLGSFLTAVVGNDFISACTLADVVNRRALYLFAMFLLNRVPSDKLNWKRGR